MLARLPKLRRRITLRTKLITIGLSLAFFAIASMGYFYSRLLAVAEYHRVATAQVNSLIRVHSMARLVHDVDSQLRANAAKPNRKWIDLVRSTHTEISITLVNIEAELGSHPRVGRHIPQVRSRFDHWQTTVVNPLLSGNTNYTLNSSLLNLIEAIRHLEIIIGNESITADANVMKTARRAQTLLIVTSILFFLTLSAFLIMIWRSVIPGMDALLTAAREIKAGHLSHQIDSKLLVHRDEIGTLARTFNEMATSLKEHNEKMLELNHLKTDFVSTVSHELRTPLTAIKGGLGLVLGGVTGAISNESRELLQITAKNTDRLIRLINDVLDVSKIEAGALKLSLDKYSINDLLNLAVRSLDAYASYHKITIRWTPLAPAPLVVVDRDRFEQIVTNLLSNAIKFSPEGATVTLSCELARDHVTFKVSDSGPGISLEQQNKLFRKFQQIGRVNNKNNEGTGLGLYIAKSLVEQQGGRIWVESMEGEGASFYFTVPWNGADFEAADVSKAA